MKRSTSSNTLLLTLAAIVLSPMLVFVAADRIQVVRHDADKRVDIVIDGKPFTSYIYPGGDLKKPALNPIRTAMGHLITRGYPLEPRKGEPRDHPHHVGFWFNYGDVNGLDFWNNSEAIKADQATKYGTIVHKKIVEAKGGANQGELAVEAEWVKSDGTPLLKEQTRFIFRGDGAMRSIERITTLTALGVPVDFNDNKEGVIGLRVARELQQPATRAEVVTDDKGKATEKPVLDNTGVTGSYLSSEGLKGDAVWGTRARWTTLSGTIESEPVTLAMLDHPSNPGYPTYWHARGYGLYAANPLGQKALSSGKAPESKLTLEPGKSTTFKYRLLIMSSAATPDVVEREYKAFAAAAGLK